MSTATYLLLQMPPKHPYIDEANKGAFLALLGNGDSTVHATKKAKNNPKSARRIKHHSSEVQIFYDDYELPTPSLHDRVAIKSKSGRPYVHIRSFWESIRNHLEMFQCAVHGPWHITLNFGLRVLFGLPHIC